MLFSRLIDTRRAAAPMGMTGHGASNSIGIETIQQGRPDRPPHEAA